MIIGDLVVDAHDPEDCQPVWTRYSKFAACVSNVTFHTPSVKLSERLERLERLWNRSWPFSGISILWWPT